MGNPCKLKRINTTRSDCDSSKNKAKEAKVGESKPPKKMSETSEANNLPNDHTPGEKTKCMYCNQAYLKKQMEKHTKSGKCKKYSPYIKFSPIFFYCKLCLKVKYNRKAVHGIYRHLEFKHKAEMATV